LNKIVSTEKNITYQIVNFKLSSKTEYNDKPYILCILYCWPEDEAVRSTHFPKLKT